MSTATGRETRGGKSNHAPRDHYQEVTDRIIAALEAGTPPWRKPWDPDKAGGPAMPRNAATGQRYRGINMLTLGMSALAFSSGDPRWATYKQAADEGWQVHRGEHGTTGYFFKRLEVRNDSQPDDENDAVRRIPLLRAFILSDRTLIGLKKTRAMSAWAERRGFRTSIHERLFDKHFKRQPEEPAVALCGLDNGLGRQALDQIGFELVVEAGLGRGYRDFRAIRLHTLPASRSAAGIWAGEPAGDDTRERPAYTDMLTRGELDRCGVTLLSGKAVGAPFVGSVAATLVIAEVLRLLHEGPVNELVDLDLKAPDYRVVVPTETDFSAFNPGFASIGDR